MKDSNVIKSVKYIYENHGIKMVIITKIRVCAAKLTINGKEYPDAFNDCEPYDRKGHVFYISGETPKNKDTIIFSFKKILLHRIYGFTRKKSFAFGDAEKCSSDILFDENDSQIAADKEEHDYIADGVEFTHYYCSDKNKMPVHVLTLIADTKKTSVYIGTPNDGYKNRFVKAKVPQMIDSAVNNGVDVLAAVNADFFDMFGDGHPSGLCVKNGRLIANADSKRPFVGMKKDGTAVITSLAEDPKILSELDQAAAGLQMLVKDGKICEWAPLEPFAYVRHPRTAAGITGDGKLLFIEIDGRIPEWSNGATLLDLAKIMIKLGADRAINLDGGGSSIMYTKGKNGFDLRNNPADLFHPNAMMIRKEFNCILITSKNENNE